MKLQPDEVDAVMEAFDPARSGWIDFTAFKGLVDTVTQEIDDAARAEARRLVEEERLRLAPRLALLPRLDSDLRPVAVKDGKLLHDGQNPLDAKLDKLKEGLSRISRSK